MGTLLNGIKAIFATAKTTGSNVNLCGNDGTPDGHMTMSNLASVLGVGRLEGGTSADNLTQGFTAWWFSTKSEAEALGFVESGNNLVFAFSFDGVQGSTYASGQLCFAQVTNGLYFRTKDSGGGARWGNWVRVYDTSLLTNSTMLGQLANALGVPKSYGELQSASDFNNYTDTGTMLVYTVAIKRGIQNAPNNIAYGWLEVTRVGGGSRIVQRYYKWGTAPLALYASRSKEGDGAWTSWYYY